jgi:hypothetical protein
MAKLCRNKGFAILVAPKTFVCYLQVDYDYQCNNTLAAFRPHLGMGLGNDMAISLEKKCERPSKSSEPAPTNACVSHFTN